MGDDWFQKNFGHIIQFQKDEYRKLNFENTQLGMFKITSTGGTVGGTGGDIVLCDDPQNPTEHSSQAAREQANAHVEYLATTRLNNPKKSAFILIMQRLHPEDATHVLTKHWDKLGEDYCHLNIPAIFSERTKYFFPVSKFEAQLEDGAYFWPNRFGEKELEATKETFGPYQFQAQYQQNPTPEGGGMIKRQWFETKEIPPTEIIRTGWFWDLAVKDKQTNDYSAGALIHELKNGFYLAKMIRVRLPYPDVKNLILQCYHEARTHVVCVEDKSAGEPLLQEFKRSTLLPMYAFKPQGDKVFRASLVLPLIAAGKISLPNDGPWVNSFLEECDQFPRGPHDDQIDAIVMGLIYFHLLNKVATVGDVEKMEKKNVHFPSMKKKQWW